MTPDEIIERYRRADAHERLHLFLQFRDLREAFDDIDGQDGEGNVPCPVLQRRGANALRDRLGILDAS